MASLHDQYKGYGIEALLDAMALAADPGSRNAMYLENLLAVRTAEMVNKQLIETANVTSVSANLIKDQIGSLTSNLTEASAKLHAASEQSSKLGNKLNLLTAAIAFAAILSACATIFQGMEAKRQADLMERQLQLQAQPASPSGQKPEDVPQPKQ